MIKKKTVLVVAVLCAVVGASVEAADKPNVLFIAIDDMNDWTTLFDDNNPIKTPNLKRLASRGCFFTQAYCASPGCNQSRTALMTGLRPTSSGVYANPDPWRKMLPDAVTLPEYFVQYGGYATRGAGKIFHHGKAAIEDGNNAFQEFQSKLPIRGPGKNSNYNGYRRPENPKLSGVGFDWGEHDQKMIDVDMCEYVEARMEEKWDRPLFLAAGIFNPHLPFYAPKETFARYPFEQTMLPPMPKGDLDDVGEVAKRMVRKEYWVYDNTTAQEPTSPGSLKKMVQCYHAAADFADQMVGRLIDKLDETGRAEDTIIVLWADHGYHLGDKETCVKFTLWEKASHVPFIIVAPGVTEPGSRCDRPVSLIDIYPTLLELAGLPAKEDNDGVSLVQLLKDPSRDWDRPALITEGPGNHAVRSDRWRYIRYSDGAEELYDHENDRWEHDNLAGDSKYASVIAEHRKWLPEKEAPGRGGDHLYVGLPPPGAGLPGSGYSKARAAGGEPTKKGKGKDKAERTGSKTRQEFRLVQETRQTPKVSATSAVEGLDNPFAEKRLPPAAPSKIPHYKFANTLDEQEKQLASNPYLDRVHASRKAMAGDPHRPFYHYVNPEGRLNDPNGLCFWKGRWHLFYQAYPPEDPRQHWGHAVSDDLIHWRDLPLAIYPDPEDKCFSGSCYVDGDRVIAAYHGIGRGTMVAVSSDPLLLNWEKVTGDAVIKLPEDGDPNLPYNIFDPCIWKQGDYYYLLTAGQSKSGPGGTPVRAEYLHRSKDLATWEYLHPFLENDQLTLIGDDGACPYFWPIGGKEQNKHIMLHFSHMSGGKYMIGDYDTERDKFVVTAGGDFNHGSVAPGGTHAPSAHPDPQNAGAVIALFNMNPGMATKGWNQIFSLPRRLTLSDEGVLESEPGGDIESLRKDHVRVEARRLPANEEVVFKAITGNSMELNAEIRVGRASSIELNVLRSPGKQEFTRILFQPDAGFKLKHDWRRHRKQRVLRHHTMTIDTSRSTTLSNVQARPPEVAQVLAGKTRVFKLRVFVDKSIVEVFVDGRQCSAVRVYPGREDSLGVSLRAIGGNAQLLSLDAWQMENIYE